MMLRLALHTHLVLLLAVVCPPISATASTFRVTTTTDSHDVIPGDSVCDDGTGACSLRAALDESNALDGADTILLSDAAVYRLELGALALLDNGTVLRADSGMAIIDAATNPPYGPAIIISSDSNTVQRVIIQHSFGDGIRIEGSANLIGGDEPT
ncbi:MAG: hypothetical protein D6800_11450, partial [Candidatus Zixiibacteriota bacterium]